MSSSPVGRFFKAPALQLECRFTKLVLGLSFTAAAMFSEGALHAADEYYKVDGTNSAWTSSVWSLTGSAPYSSAWTSGNNAVFSATSAITGATTTVANITANADVSVAAGGTMTFSNTLLTVAPGKTFTFAGLSINPASGFTKSGDGTLTSGLSTAYTGGFTLNAGTVNIAGTNAIGGGTLTINGGTLQSNSGTARSPAVTQINVGGDFSFGGTNAGALSFSASVGLGSSTHQITVDNTANATSFSGVISGASGTGLTKAGLGELDFSGSASNTYTGLTTISAGTLGLGMTTAALNAFTGDLTINGGTVNYSSAKNDQIPDAAKVTISSGGLVVGARSETIGTTATVASGLAVSGTGAITISSGTLNVANSASMTAGSITVSGSGTLQTNTDLAMSGGTIDFTYTGATAGGILLRGGDGTGISYASSGATTAVISNSGGGADRLSLNTATNATTVFNIDDSSSVTNEMTISAIITGATTNALQKTGAGQLTLSGANSYQGRTIVTRGTVVAANDSALGNSTLSTAGVLMNPVMGNTATVNFTSASPAIASLASSGLGSSNVVLGNVTSASATALTVGANNASTSFAGVISDNSVAAAAAIGNLRKTGTGTLTLTGVNIFTGSTTIAGGTLAAAATGGRALGTITQLNVNNGGTLLLSTPNQLSTSAPVSMAGGIIQKAVGANQGAANTLGLGALSLSANSTLDYTQSSGSLTFAGFTPGTYVLAITNYIGDGTTNGDEHLYFNADQSSNLDHFNFGAGTGSNFIGQTDLGNGFYEVYSVVPVPEPATILGALLMVGAGGYSQRRRLRFTRNRSSQPPLAA